MRYKIANTNHDMTKRAGTERSKRAVPWDASRGPDAVALGVPFGGHISGYDTDGERFMPQTDIMLAVGDVRPLTYYHGIGPDGEMQIPPAVIGAAKFVRTDERGNWFELQLSQDEPLARRVMDALRSGEDVKASSGAVSHLVRVTAGGDITTWPVGELAVFDTAKSRRPANELAIVTLPESETQEMRDGGGVEIAQKQESAKSADNKGVNIMDEKQVNGQPQVDINDLVSRAAKSAVEQAAEMYQQQAAKMAAEAAQEAADKAAKAAAAEALERVKSNSAGVNKAPAVLNSGRGDSFAKAANHWVLTGEKSSGLEVDGNTLHLKASNPVDMSIGTPAAGGYAAHDDWYREIIAKAGEMMLAQELGLRNIPGTATTIDVVVDNSTNGGEFIATAEGGTYDKDTPPLNLVQMTLAKYTKNVPLTNELLSDENTNLLPFLTDFVARGLAFTHNSLFVAEVTANGTSFSTFASNSAIAAGEPQDIVFNDTLAPYIDDGGSVAWVMRSSTFGSIASVQGNPFLYAATGGSGRELLGYPVSFSAKVDAIGSSAKSVLFGNWYYVAWRDGGGLDLLRDPYSSASTGIVNLWYSFRTAYKVLQADAVGYGVHPV